MKDTCLINQTDNGHWDQWLILSLGMKVSQELTKSRQRQVIRLDWFILLDDRLSTQVGHVVRKMETPYGENMELWWYDDVAK